MNYTLFLLGVVQRPSLGLFKPFFDNNDMKIIFDYVSSEKRLSRNNRIPLGGPKGRLKEEGVWGRAPPTNSSTPLYGKEQPILWLVSERGFH